MNNSNVTVLMEQGSKLIISKHDEPGNYYWLDPQSGTGVGPFSSISAASIDLAFFHLSGVLRNKISLTIEPKDNIINIDFVTKRRT